MSADAQVLILGGGLSGCLVAAGLADQGLRVSIIEKDEQLLSAASRWNDGKIHLGYTFTGTSSLATAELMQDGSAVFFDGMEQAIGEALPESCQARGVVYVVDPESMVDPETLWARAKAVARLHDDRAKTDVGMRRYLSGLPGLERLPVERARHQTGQDNIVAAWHTPERHVDPRNVADRLSAAVLARDVDVIQGEVCDVQAGSPGWQVDLADGTTVRAIVVVNCLWENRAVIDRRVRPDSEPTSIRYKRALFGTGAASLAQTVASTRVLGRFGDVVSYGNGSAYLSWYPAGLVARSDDGIPPPVPRPRHGPERDAILAGLRLPPSVLDDAGAEWQLRGGFVVAWGHGDIDRADSPLHERHRPDVSEIEPGFLSVDTGKYTLGPLLATRAVGLAARAVSHRVASDARSMGDLATTLRPRVSSRNRRSATIDG